MLPASQIKERWENLCGKVEELGGDGVTIIAVTKTFPPEIFQLCADLGIEHVGENRVNELKTKSEVNAAILDRLKVHFIGALQTNKAKELDGRADSFDALHSMELAKKVDARWSQPNPLPVLLQINSTGEAQKSGLRGDTPHDQERLNEVVEFCIQSKKLKLEGIMTMGPTPEGSYNPQSQEYVNDTKRAFHAARQLLESLEERYQLKLPRLSMGMSHDYPIALDCGANEIRVGSMIFGARGAV